MDQDIPQAVKASKRIAIASGVTVLIGIILIVLFLTFGGKNKTSTAENSVPTIIQPTPLPTNEAIVSPTPTVTASERSETSATEYTSARLRLNFSYVKNDPLAAGNVEDIQVKEVGNKIFVYPQTLSPENGQYVEVFKKNETETIDEAISRLFLTGKDPSRCQVTVAPAIGYPDGYLQAEITSPLGGENTNENAFASTEYCSPDYGQTNGIRYFLADTAHPETLLFFSIGQYGIMSADNIPWQQTVRFN